MTPLLAVPLLAVPLQPDRDTARAWAEQDVAKARAKMKELVGQFEEVHPGAASSILEGLEETLTLHRLGVFRELGISLKTTNLLESVHARIEARVQKVDHWRTKSALDIAPCRVYNHPVSRTWTQQSS